jgi:hypothetical protein
LSPSITGPGYAGALRALVVIERTALATVLSLR